MAKNLKPTFREESDTSGSSTSSGFLASNRGGKKQQEDLEIPQQNEREGGREEEEEREEDEDEEEEQRGQKADRRKQPTPVKNKSASAPSVKQVARKSTAAAAKVLLVRFPNSHQGGRGLLDFLNLQGGKKLPMARKAPREVIYCCKHSFYPSFLDNPYLCYPCYSLPQSL